MMKDSVQPQNRGEIRVLYDHRSILIFDKTDQGSSSRRYLILGDLHIGFEEKFRAQGVKIEASVDRLIEEIKSIADLWKITDIVINGDVKSSITNITSSEWEKVPKFFDGICDDLNVKVILGNHDAGIKQLLPAKVDVADSTGLLLGNNLVMHGHTNPILKYRNCKRLIMGHLHPIYLKKGSPLSGQPVWIFAKVPRTYVFQGMIAESVASHSGEDLVEVIVMPSFNLDLIVSAYSKDTAREERRTAPMVRSLYRAEEAAIVTVEGDLIGDASLLNSIL